MATKKRVETVSLSSLSKSIDKAVSLAGDKHGVSFDDAVTDGLSRWRRARRPQTSSIRVRRPGFGGSGEPLMVECSWSRTR